MQAANVTRDLRDKFERIMRDGHEQYTLASAPAWEVRYDHLQQAYAAFTFAQGIADTAAKLAPVKDYSRWTERRSLAGRSAMVARTATWELVSGLAVHGAEVAA